MSAVFGYELDLTKLSPEEEKQVKDQIISYQTIRPVIQYGHYYRLASPFEENIAAWMFVSLLATITIVRRFAQYELSDYES